jgi:hypothetical protein
VWRRSYTEAEEQAARKAREEADEVARLAGVPNLLESENRWTGTLGEWVFVEWCRGRVTCEHNGGFDGLPDVVLRGRGAEVKTCASHLGIYVPLRQRRKAGVVLYVFVSIDQRQRVLGLPGVISVERWDAEAVEPGDWPSACRVLPATRLAATWKLWRLGHDDRDTARA